MARTPAPPDSVDALLAAWRAARPDLDPAPLGLVGRVLLLAQRLEAGVEVALKPFGLSLGQFDILATLRRCPDGRLTPTQLLESVVLSSGGMTGRLDKLAALGAVVRTADPADRRGVVVALTPKGKKLIDAATAARFAEAEAATAGLAPAERAALEGLLRRWLGAAPRPDSA